MAKRKSVEELEKAAKAAELRAKKYRAQAKKATEAEEAKVNAEIIKALKEWLSSWPKDKRKEWEELPAYFHEQAEKNRTKYADKNNAALKQLFAPEAEQSENWQQ